MQGGNGRLKAVGAEAPRLQRLADQIAPFGDGGPVPEAAILLFQRHQIALTGGAGRSPRILKQKQRQQPLNLGLGKQLRQQPGQADGLGRKIRSQQVAAIRRRIAFVEHQIDDPQHIAQPRR